MSYEGTPLAPTMQNPTPHPRRLDRIQAILAVAAALLAVALLVARWQLLPPAPVTLDLGSPNTSASHFYGIETAPDRSFRWSREMSAVSLPALASSVVLSATLDPARPPGQPLPEVHLRVGDDLFGRFSTDPGWQTYASNTGPGLSTDVRLVVESDTFYPGVGDRRLLGVAVSQVAVSPAPNRFGLIFPPLLWLVLATLTPLLAIGCLAMVRPAGTMSAQVAAFGVSALVPVLFSVLVPASLALPSYTWLVGLLAAGVLLAWLWRLGAPGSDLAARLAKLGSSRWEVPLVGALSAAVALATTWPLLLRLGDSLPGWPADNFAFLYKIWWFRTALLEEGRSPFFDPGSYAPFGFNLGLGEPTLANTVPGVVIAALTNDIVAYNLLALGSFIVSGIGAYLLVRELTGSRLAALLASLAFAFCPYRMSQFAGHLQLLGTGWIALAFYFLERLLKTGKLRDGVALGISFGLAALSAWYYAYMVALALGVYLLLRYAILRPRPGIRRIVRPLAAGAAVFLLLASPVAVPSLQLWEQGGLTHSAKAADEHSAAPTDYLVVNPLQPVWGEAGMRSHAEQNVIESALYVGIVLVIVVVSGWWFLKRGNDKGELRKWWPWLGLATVAFVLSLGLTLHDSNGQVRIGQAVVIPLPGQLLYDWLPLYSSMRAFARFGIIVALAASVLLGLAWAAWLRFGPMSVRLRPVFATVLVAGILLADYWTGPYAWGTSLVRQGETAAYIAGLPSGTVGQMPLESSQSGPALYRRVTSGKPVAYGYETFEPPEWRARREELQEFPEDAALDVLAEWDVRYVVVSGKAYGADYPGMLDHLRTLPRLRFLAAFEEEATWRVDPGVLDARPDMVEYSVPETNAVFELVR